MGCWPQYMAWTSCVCCIFQKRHSSAGQFRTRESSLSISWNSQWSPRIWSSAKPRYSLWAPRCEARLRSLLRWHHVLLLLVSTKLWISDPLRRNPIQRSMNKVVLHKIWWHWIGNLWQRMQICRECRFQKYYLREWCFLSEKLIPISRVWMPQCTLSPRTTRVSAATEMLHVEKDGSPFRTVW